MKAREGESERSEPAARTRRDARVTSAPIHRLTIEMWRCRYGVCVSSVCVIVATALRRASTSTLSCRRVVSRRRRRLLASDRGAAGRRRRIRRMFTRWGDATRREATLSDATRRSLAFRSRSKESISPRVPCHADGDVHVRRINVARPSLIGATAVNVSHNYKEGERVLAVVVIVETRRT